MVASGNILPPPPGRVTRDLSVIRMLYSIARKHQSWVIIQWKLQRPRVWLLSLDRLPVV